MNQIPSAARAELVPSGKLRVGVNLGNFLLVNQTPVSSELRGVVPDLAHELGRRLAAPVVLIPCSGAGEVADGAKTGAWDVAFIGAEPQRAQEIAFTPAYLEIPASYLVPAGSPIRTLDQVDRPGVRIAVSARSAYDLYLSRHLKHAQLLRAEGIPASYDLFIAEQLEVLAGLLPRLVSEVLRLPGARILEGRFTAIQQAIGTPKARAAGAEYLCQFVADIKSSGLVAQLIERHGAKGVMVAQ
ncbi:MAG: transporter substrate-binding domain-containing protein [Betaproteobacteria bacterium]|nr:transporter substrate-binding domain-containing protein [Betaproteobacteria bacterium]